MTEIVEEFIIVDLNTRKALYGREEKTLKFSSFVIAEEVAKQFFNSNDDYLIVSIT